VGVRAASERRDACDEHAEQRDDRAADGHGDGRRRVVLVSRRG
jgi:hypothetical protein